MAPVLINAVNHSAVLAPYRPNHTNVWVFNKSRTDEHLAPRFNHGPAYIKLNDTDIDKDRENQLVVEASVKKAINKSRNYEYLAPRLRKGPYYIKFNDTETDTDTEKGRKDQ